MNIRYKCGFIGSGFNMKNILLFFTIALLFNGSAQNLPTSTMADLQSPEPYEQFKKDTQNKYMEKLKELEDYLKDVNNIMHCEKMEESEVAYRLTYKNNFEGVLKYYSDNSISLREAAAFAVAKDLGMRSVAPIVGLNFSSNLCEGIPNGAFVTISYFIKNSTHLSIEKHPEQFSKEKKKYDWFNFLLLDCDHDDHNILLVNEPKAKSYLIDYDWAFVLPTEIKRIQSQPGFENWCRDYLSIVDRLENYQNPLPANGLCSRFPELAKNKEALSKIEDYGKGNFPQALEKLSLAQQRTFRLRSLNFHKAMKCTQD